MRVERRVAAMVLGSAVLSGCGFRSEIDDPTALVVVSLAFDAAEYLQGQSGQAHLGLTNPTAVPVAVPAPVLKLLVRDERTLDVTFTAAPGNPAEVLPGETVELTYDVLFGDAIPIGPARASVELAGKGSPEVALTLRRAATLEVESIRFAVVNSVPIDYTCRETTSAPVLVDFRNIGESPALLDSASLRVVLGAADVTGLFTVTPAMPTGSSVPSSLGPGETAAAGFMLRALTAEIGNQYQVIFAADVTDGTTGRARPDPAQVADLFVTVHRRGTATPRVEEGISVFPIQQAQQVGVEIQNQGTVPVVVQSASLRMTVGTIVTTGEYLITAAPQSPSLPETIPPLGSLSLPFAVTLPAPVTFGLTTVAGVVAARDSLCDQNLNETSTGASSGAWAVE